MERRMLLAVLLSIITVVGYSALTGRCSPQPKPDPVTENGEGDPDDNSASAGDPRPGNPPAVKDDGSKKGVPAKGDEGPKGDEPEDDEPSDDDATHPQKDVVESHATLTSKELTVTLSSQCGAVESASLNGATEGDQSSAFDLIVPPSPSMMLGATDDTKVTPVSSPGGADRKEIRAGPMRSSLQWTQDEAAAKATPENDAFFTFTTSTGLTWTKRWILSDGEDRYDLSLELSVHAAGSTDAPKRVDVSMLTSTGHLREDIRSAFANPSQVLWRRTDQDDLQDETDYAHGIPIEELPQEGVNRQRLAIFGVRSAYFLSMYYRLAGPNEPDILHFWATGIDASKRGEYEENLARFWKDRRELDVTTNGSIQGRISAGVESMLHCWVTARLPVHADAAKAQAGASAFHFYLGPNERGVVRQDVYGPLDSIVAYPNAPDFVADILMWIYDLWFGLLGSAGLAVILMTLCVRGGLMPISIRNQLSMRKYGRKVAKLKPKVADLQKKYANNPKKMRDEQMKLYREHGVGFPSGCLMMLIQIPIFFSLFSALRVEYTLRGESFLWIKDLAGPDRLVDFGSRVLDLGFFWVEGINLLPILMVGLSILHTRNMPKPADEQQAQQMKMMKWLPIVFAFILYNYTAALAIYMVMSSAFAIIESKVVRSKDEADVAAEEAAAPAKA